MAKHVSRSSKIQAVPTESLLVQLTLPMLSALTSARASFQELCPVPCASQKRITGKLTHVPMSTLRVAACISYVCSSAYSS